MAMSARMIEVPVGSLDNAVEGQNIWIVGASGKEPGADWARIVDVTANDQGTVEEQLNVHVAWVISKGLAEDFDGILIAEVTGVKRREFEGEGQRFGIELETISKSPAGGFRVSEHVVRMSQVQGEWFGAGSVVEKLDDADVVFAIEQVCTQALQRFGRGWVDGKNLLPLLFGFGALAGG